MQIKKTLFIFLLLLPWMVQPVLTQQTFEGKTINALDAEGKKTGPWVIFGKDQTKPGYAPDAKVEEGEYTQGRKSGLWNMYFPNGNRKSEITYTGGRPKGPYKVFYKDGKIEEEGNWRSTRNTGAFKRYYPNGQISQQFNFGATGRREGPQKYFYENGNTMIEGDWAGGREAGELKRYTEDGELKSIQYFNEGKVDPAKTKKFNVKNDLVATVAIEPEVPAETKVIAIAPKKEKVNVGVFKDNGHNTLYNKNKQITKKGLFVNGRLKDGEIRKYTADGILKSIAIYRNFGYIGEGVLPEDK